MRPVVSERCGRFASRAKGFAAGEHPRRACPGWVQPPRWWLSGDTDEEWVDRLDEGADQPFLHGLTERLPLDVSVRLSSRRVVLKRSLPKQKLVLGDSPRWDVRIQ